MFCATFHRHPPVNYKVHELVVTGCLQFDRIYTHVVDIR